MNCDDMTNDVLADLADGSLAEAERETVEDHLSSCAACRDRAREVAALLKGLEAWPPEKDVPESVDRGVEAFVARRAAAPAARPVGRLGILVPVAAALILAATAYVAGALGGLPGTEPGEGTPPPSVEKADAKAERAKEKRRFEETLASVRIALEEAKIDRDRFAEKLLGTGLDLSAARKEIETLGKKVVELGEKHEKEKERADGLALRVESLNRDVKEQKDALAGSEAKRIEVRKRVESLEEEKKALAEALGAARSEITTVRKEAEALRERVEVKGDWNGDGRADVRDVRGICLLLAAGKALPFVAGADLNEDGKIDVGDALLIAKSTMRSQ